MKTKRPRIGILLFLFIAAVLIPSSAQENGGPLGEWDEAYQNHFEFLADRGNISEETITLVSRLDTAALRTMEPREAAEKMFRLIREADSTLRRGSSQVGIMTELNSRLREGENDNPGASEAMERAGKELQQRSRESLLEQTRRGLRENAGQRGSPPSERAPARAGASAAGRPDTPDHR